MSDSPSAADLSRRKSQAVSHRAGHLPDEGCAGAGDLYRQGQELCAAAPARIFTRPPAAIAGSATGSARSPTSSSWPPTARSMRFLMEARLVKDIQPKHNRDLKDDKTFPYLQITTGEDFPRVEFHPPAA